jgi:hypothetical protein
MIVASPATAATALPEITAAMFANSARSRLIESAAGKPGTELADPPGVAAGRTCEFEQSS